MKTILKYAVLFLLALATLFSFACKKPEENGPQEAEKFEIIIPEGLNFVLTEDGYTYLVEGQHYAGEELEIPGRIDELSQVSEIGSFGFSNLTGLKKVTFPSTIRKINAAAFEGCTALTAINLPGTVQIVGTEAFEDCTSLSAVSIPADIALCSDAFKGCTSLSEITYRGTLEQWQATIQYYGTAWIEADKTVTIHCTDGDYVLNEK